MLTFQSTTINGIAVIRLSRSFIDAERNILEIALSSVLEYSQHAFVILDLSGVTAIEEGIWDVLRNFHHTCCLHGGTCCIADVPNDMDICMHLSWDCFTIFPSVAEALASLSPSSSPKTGVS